jgi:hypothetical protein
MTKGTTPISRIDLNPLQVFASALAAVTAAVLGSRLGMVGTIGGAAVGSAVTSTASTLYLHSMERARTVVGRTAPLSRPLGTPPLGGQPTGVPAEKEPVARHRLGWGLAAAGAVVAFVLSLTVITGLESARGRPLSGDGGGGGTTLGRVLDGPAPAATTTPAPTPTPSGTPSGSATPTPTATTDPTGTPTPTADPTETGVPTTTPPPSTAPPSDPPVTP